MAMGRVEGTEDARERLLRVAAALFAEKGYAATSVREIVAAAGVTNPVLYYHFQNKEGLYLSLLRESHEAFEVVIEERRRATGSPGEQLTDLVEAVYRLFEDQLSAARIIFASFYGPRMGVPTFDFERHSGHLLEAVRALVEEGVVAGEFEAACAEELTWGVPAVLLRACHDKIKDPETAIGAGQLRRMVEFLLRGARPAAGRRG